MNPGLSFKVKKKLKFWLYGAKKPWLPRKRWQKALKQQKYNRKKLFKIIWYKKLFKKKISYRRLLIQKRHHKKMKKVNTLKNRLTFAGFNHKDIQYYFSDFKQIVNQFINQFLSITNIDTKNKDNVYQVETPHFLTLKRRL